MINITGSNEITILAQAGEIYKLSYEITTAVDIKNDTDSEIYVNSNGNFEQHSSTGVGNYLSLGAGDCYNGYRPAIMAGMTIYIYAKTTGNICVVVKGY